MSDDVSPAEWIAPRLTGGFGAVTRTVPCGYPAYARICHPAGARDGGLATWSEVAQATGRQTHPVMQWHALVVSADHLNANGSVWPGHNPEQGNFECFYGGSGDPTNVDYQAGARVTQSQFVALQPRGVIHGDVSLVITTGPSAPAPSPQPKDRASGETSTLHDHRAVDKSWCQLPARSGAEPFQTRPRAGAGCSLRGPRRVR